MTLCIYHGNCADGFGAAWVIRKYFQELVDKTSSTVEFYPGVYQKTPPDVTGKDVILVDFSYKRPVMLELASKARSILVLDHHKSAAEDLQGLDYEVQKLGWFNVLTVFDMKQSGAMLAWKYYFPNKSPPKLIEHIQDRDLWHFALPGTSEIQANVFSYPYDFDVWDGLMETPIETLRIGGEGIVRKQHKDMIELVKTTKRRMVIGGFNVPVANLPYTLSSEAGHFMAHGEPFAACYWDVPDGRVYSLRSSDEGQDVSIIASLYGGGGHRNAAGFKVLEGHVLWRA